MTMLNRYGEHLNSVETLSFLEPSRQGFRACLSGERVERRLAAILAADVAGYSRLMGADEEGRTNGSKRISGSWSNRKSPSITAASSRTRICDVPGSPSR
jgi:hypothetical protein